MDFFGIGSAVKGAARIYFQSARRTGRTTALINSLKDGDRVFFGSRQEADRIRCLCQDRKIEVECLVVDPKNPKRLFDHRPADGRALFDHTWVEQFYLDELKRTEQHLDSIQARLSRDSQERSEFADEVSRKWL